MQNELQTIVSFKKIKGAQFVGVRNYKAESGEESNQTFNVGVNYETVLQNDLKALLSLDLNPIVNKFDGNVALVNEAKESLENSLVKRLSDAETKAKLLAAGDTTIIRSEAQKDAYVHIASGIKAKEDKGEVWLYVYGFMVRKTIITPGVYKETKSALSTIVKNAITKAAQLKGDKFRTFKLNNVGELRLSGKTIDFKELVKQ